MSTKYLDYSGLSYFWGKLKNYLATTTHSGLMSAADKTKVDMITTDGTIAFYRKEESVYVTETEDEDTIPIGISGFTTADMLLVDINGLDLSEGEEYVISGNNIVLDTPIGTIGTVVHFVVLRAITATAADVATLKGEKGEDGVVQDVLQNGVSVLGQDGVARIVAETDVGTSTPTADTTAKFDNNACMNSTDMTAQDVSDFVDGLNASGLTAVDYVVEQGTGYGGKYRKWNSGKCELWISVSANSGLNTSIWQSPIAYGDYNYSTQWNGLFNATPIVQATTNHNFIFAVIPTNITKNGLSLRFLTVTALSNSSYAYSLYVVGTWK